RDIKEHVVHREMLPQILEHSSECGVDLEAAANPEGNLSKKFISVDGHNNCSSMKRLTAAALLSYLTIYKILLNQTIFCKLLNTTTEQLPSDVSSRSNYYGRQQR